MHANVRHQRRRTRLDDGCRGGTTAAHRLVFVTKELAQVLTCPPIDGLVLILPRRAQAVVDVARALLDLPLAWLSACERA
jgi:hypothetical protein